MLSNNEINLLKKVIKHYFLIFVIKHNNIFLYHCKINKKTENLKKILKNILIQYLINK